MFESYLFEVDPNKVEDDDVLKNRPILIAALVAALGFLIYLLGYYWGLWIVLIGIFIYILFRIIPWKGAKEIGLTKQRLIITEHDITIDDVVVNFSDVEKIDVRINNFQNKLKMDFERHWRSRGVDNFIRITKDGKELEFQFWIPSKADYKLLKRILTHPKVNLIDMGVNPIYAL